MVKNPFSSGTPFPNNQIPASLITPLSTAVLNYFDPLPNYGTPGAIANNYETNAPTNITNNQGDMRVDRNITSKQTAFARMTYKEKAESNGAQRIGESGWRSNDLTRLRRFRSLQLHRHAGS